MRLLTDLSYQALPGEDAPQLSTPVEPADPSPICWATFARLVSTSDSSAAESIEFVIQLFEREVPPQIDALLAALARADRAQVRVQTHRLRGGCVQLGAQALGALCEEIEKMADPGEQAAALEARLRACYEATLGALRQRSAAA